MSDIREIYLSGSFNANFHSGTYDILLNDSNENKDVISKKEYGTSVNNILLKGLLEAIGHCSNDTEVTVYSNTSLGWNNAKKSKNKELLQKIQDTCNKRGIVLRVIEKADLGYLKDLIKAYKI